MKMKYTAVVTTPGCEDLLDLGQKEWRRLRDRAFWRDDEFVRIETVETVLLYRTSTIERVVLKSERVAG